MKIALLHALPFDQRMWEPQLEALADHEVHAPKLYDLGSSTDEWALAVLQQVPGQLVAVGASMGGYTAAAIARLAPERLLGLVLSGSRADADAPERRPLREQWIQVARERGGEGMWDEVARNFFPEDADPAVVERAHEIAAEQEPEGLVRAIQAIRDRPDSTEAVVGGPPLLVVAGERDPLIPPEVGQALAAAAGGRVEVLPTGHLPNLERPDGFNLVLSDFLASL
jgi:3-oxoadipate enol-lactonase